VPQIALFVSLNRDSNDRYGSGRQNHEDGHGNDQLDDRESPAARCLAADWFHEKRVEESAPRRIGKIRETGECTSHC
jgi:hypothetical protein